MRVHITAHLHDRSRRKLQQQSYEELVASLLREINENDAVICKEIPEGGEDLPSGTIFFFGNIIQFCLAHSVAERVSRQLDASEFMKVRREYTVAKRPEPQYVSARCVGRAVIVTVVGGKTVSRT